MQGDGGHVAWNTIERYLALDELENFHKPPRLRVRVMDKDPGEESDDLIGASELSLEELSGKVERLELPCDEAIIREQAKRDEEIRKAATAALRHEYEKRCAEAKAKGVSLPRMPQKLVYAQQEERSKREASSSRPLLSPSREAGSHSRAASERSQSSSRGKTSIKPKVERLATTTISFEYSISEFHPPPTATLHLRRITVLSGLAFKQPALAVTTATAKTTAKAAKVGTPSKSERSAATSLPPRPGVASSPIPAVVSGELGKPYLRFVLLEVGEEHGTERTTAMTKPAPLAAPSKQPWTDAPLQIKLPAGSPRPPLLCVTLCDQTREEQAAAKSKVAPPVSEAELRLTGASGSTEVALDFRYKEKGIGKVKQVKVRLDFEVEDEDVTTSMLHGEVAC